MKETPDAVCQKPGDRLFVAVELSEEIKVRLLNVRTFIPGLKWTPNANLHLTLHFIGQIPQDSVALLRQSLRRIKGDAFRLNVVGLGLFRQRAGGILWAGITKEPALIKLKHQVDEALWGAIELSLDEKDYSPHVTLSRLKKPISPPLKSLVQENAAAHFGTMDVTDFVLFRSLLRPAGAIHEPVERHRLNVKAL
ncbi:MAG: RNA 2',3'-cyclic phosphodiesterase [Betaproteobacteria bacterium]|nr:RNA 2',3'-cyclic phosphodiesterase [Betaproteobacteria bacterium]